jgi:hypothetical protein
MSDELRELAIRLLIGCAAVTWMVVLWRADRNPALPNFSFRNMFATREGYPDRAAIMEGGSWLVMSAVVVIAVLRNSTSIEALCGIYVGAFVLRAAHSAYLHATNPPLPGTISRTHESTIDTRTVEGPKPPTEEPAR